MNLRIKATALALTLLTSGAWAQKYPYQNANLPVEKRVKDLLSRMTVEEKVAQMSQYVGIEHIKETTSKYKGKVDPNNDANGMYKNLSITNLEKMTEEGLVGSFLHVVTAEEANRLQALAKKSRLQIPLLIGIDAIHGNAMVAGTTVYPTPITMASSFDLDAARISSEQTAVEMRATGSQWTFTPNIDVARDARWGRVGETFGEDPYLVTRMGVATVEGFQGKDLKGANRVLACAKHLIAGGEPANGTNASPMDVSERTLREVHLPPYKAAVEEANVWTIMAAHNELNGVPCHASGWLMNDIMRKEYGFKGFFVSDWMDVYRIHSLHHFTETPEEALKVSVINGMDMNMHGPDFYNGVVQLAKSGQISMKRIDEAAGKILEAKFRLGLFENPFVDEKAVEKNVFTQEHTETALEIAEKSIVLLKNEKELLPLDLSKYKRILVTGPNANNQSILGDWTLLQPEDKVTTVLEGLEEVAKGKIQYYDYGSDVRSTDMNKVKDAADMAKSCDLAIVVVGENPLRYQKSRTTGENTDRMSLDLMGVQDQLIQEIHATGVPTIVVLVGGRPLSVNWAAENVPAIIQAWEPGSLGGKALANILTGKVNPSAKLPITMPRSSGQIQMIYNHKPSQYFHNYKDGLTTPLYPFGYGLSYTTFKTSNLSIDKTVGGLKDQFTVSVDLENTGKVKGTEILQLYIRDLYSSFTRPIKELKDFSRVELQPGEKKRVQFTITPDKLAFFDKEMKFAVEKGKFEIMVGSSSLDEDLQKLTIEIK